MNDDLHLQQSVQAELAWEPRVEATQIKVAAKDGVITLTGQVGNYAEKLAVEAAASRVKGVKVVAEELKVHFVPDPNRPDDMIAAAVLNHLDGDVYVPHDAIKVKVKKGWVTLSGQVDLGFQKQAAAEGLQRLLGVYGISNHITVMENPSLIDISDGIMHALHRSWFFDIKTIKVRSQGGKVWLSGTAVSLEDRKVAARVAWNALGVTDVQNDITVV